MNLNKFLAIIKIIFSLGIINLLYVLIYKFLKRIGFYSFFKAESFTTESNFFNACNCNSRSVHESKIIDSWCTKSLLFSFHEFNISGIPDWHVNPFKKDVRAHYELPWYKISDFSDNLGDIKSVWETSRFDWVLAFALRIACGDSTELKRLNIWLNDWVQKNPPYRGVNWKCGQEASIRVIHLSVATLILEEHDSASESLRKLITIHLKRIEQTVGYAIAQCNNHATSEAAALFIGGHLVGGTQGEKWVKRGRRNLEKLIEKLVETDGTFSQYSINYHRLMLDTICISEIWRIRNGQTKFCEAFYDRAKVSSTWLLNMINVETGDGPNVGANDGARLLQITKTKYRDFRPTVQLAYALFFDERAIVESGPWDDCLNWLNIKLPHKITKVENEFVADKGGFVVLRKNQSMVLMRYPRFKFRPSHADALHVDLTVNDLNILRDGGTYSYNTDPKWINYFSGVASHNTIQFDGMEQMPRISRFLFGDWLKTSKLDQIKRLGNGISYGAGYRLSKTINHFRRISLDSEHLVISDEIKGFQEKAVIRWRLVPGEWEMEEVENGFLATCNSHFKLSVLVSSEIPLTSGELITGWESLHYLDKTPIPVFEIETNSAGLIKTTVDWSNN